MPSLNSIGPFNFITLSSFPEASGSWIEVETRAGVDGHAYYDLGNKGQPFDVVSSVDCESIPEARVLYGLYKGNIGFSVACRWGGEEDPNHRYLIRDVRLAGPGMTPTLRRVGGLSPSGTGGCLLTCVWQLIPEKIEETPEEEP